MVVQVLFGCAAFVDPQHEIGIVGSSPELGNWDTNKAIPLTPQQPIHGSYVPTCFMAKIKLECFHNVRYKFIRWAKTSAPVQPITPLNPFTLPDPPKSLSLEAPVELNGGLFRPSEFELKIKQDTTLTPPGRDAKIFWEGDNSNDDRLLVGGPRADGSEELANLYHTHEYDPLNLHREGDEVLYLLPIQEFLNPRSEVQDQSTEVSRTTRYYYRVKQLGIIHFQQVLRNIYVGSCPRQVSHLELLKEKYGVDFVINLQTHEDVADNYISSTEPKELRNSTNLQRIYKQCGVSLVHLPVTDMCTSARAGLMAQTALIISAALIAKPERNIYIHCNAGVGRAVATVCSFLRFAIGLSEAHTSTFVKMRRTVAFIDNLAMKSGYIDFQNKYQGTITRLPLITGDYISVKQNFSV